MCCNSIRLTQSTLAGAKLIGISYSEYNHSPHPWVWNNPEYRNSREIVQSQFSRAFLQVPLSNFFLTWQFPVHGLFSTDWHVWGRKAAAQTLPGGNIFDLWENGLWGWLPHFCLPNPHLWRSKANQFLLSPWFSLPSSSSLHLSFLPGSPPLRPGMVLPHSESKRLVTPGVKFSSLFQQLNSFLLAFLGVGSIKGKSETKFWSIPHSKFQMGSK